ncbi:MAG TPA: hypothetical protein VML94_04945 [Thermoplasmata archaeon]|nr:hypothetical protein [Thermoplasmata archaeon]
MASDLVSGPDLGAGYLHQLSRDRSGETTTFTYHAQDGGQDANGPPRGPLDVFGFVHPPSACMFGGPRCWHRRFLLPFEETPGVRQAYNRHRFVLETMIAQAVDGVPATADAGVDELVARLAGPLGREGIPWYVGGSGAAWLLGSGVVPHDLDLGTSRDGVDRIGELLREYLIEPVAPTDRPDGEIVRGGRAFLGSFQAGIRVEWAVPLSPGRAVALDEWDARPGAVRLESVTRNGATIRASRPEYALVRAAEKRSRDRTRTLAAFVRARGPDRELLDALLARSVLSEPEREALRASVAPR